MRKFWASCQFVYTVQQVLSRLNSSVIIFLRVCGLSSVSSKQVSSANRVGLLCNALLRSFI